MKIAAYFFALLPLIVAALFYLSQPANPDVAEPAGTAHKPVGPQQPRPMLGFGTAQKQKAVARSKVGEPARNANESLARVAESLTPQMQQQIVDSWMRLREPAYKTLFASWNLEPAIMDQALQIIRERETHTLERRASRYAKGMSASRNGLKENAQEQDFSAIQILTLLGSGPAAELARLEADMDAKAFARAQEQIRKRAK